MDQDEIAELKGQFFEQASWGFGSRYGRTGRILSVRTEDRTLEIVTPRGALHARVGAATNIHQTTKAVSRALTFEDLTPGMLVTVDGATGTQENSAAGDIELVPEGEGGFDIASATGPRLMPIFPGPLVSGLVQREDNGTTHLDGRDVPEPQDQGFHETTRRT